MNRVLALIFWALALPCFAQTSLEVPSGNPMQFPQGDAAWKVDLTYPSLPEGSTAKRKLSIEVTRLGNVTRSIISWSDDSKTEIWHFSAKHYIAYQNPTTKSINIMWDTYGFAATLASGYDESSLSWIAPQYFKESTSYQGKSCYHYQGVISVMLPGSRGQTSLISKEAWIDKKTLLPLALNDSSCLAVFTFLPPPTDPLQPPEDIASAASRWNAALTPSRPSGVYRAPQ